MSSTKDIQFFPGLNSLRFFAALMVILSHVELVKAGMRIHHHLEFAERLNMGGLGVYFFFVLSGFLITYLLLREKHHFSTISLRKFYLRRIFRIWPLYYLLLILGFFLLPFVKGVEMPYYSWYLQEHFTGNLLLYIFILPNLAFAMYPAVPHIGQAWSIGVEEQFYIFWPILLKKIKNTGPLILTCFVVFCLLKVVLLLVAMNYPHIRWLSVLKTFFAMCKFESMMIGAYGAYLFFYNKEKMLNLIYQPWVFYGCLLSFPFISYVFYTGIIQDGIHVLLSVQFLIIILNIATNPTCAIRLRYGWMDYLGQISYGLYMYHLIVIAFVLWFFRANFDFKGFGVLSNCLVYIISVLLTIGVSMLSYHYFEKPFLRLKRKFEVHR